MSIQVFVLEDLLCKTCVFLNGESSFREEAGDLSFLDKGVMIPKAATGV